MGIKNLNRYLLDNCSKDAIKKMHLSQLSGKTIVIDTSIYLYKYASENALMEKMYLFISILRNYNITPLFIFDGKPPKEKYPLLKERKLFKKLAEQQYQDIKEKETLSKNDILLMDKLKRQCVYIYEKDIQNVKKLMDLYGVQYIVAPQEADQLCAYFANGKKVWGCMSDDTDMFVYGCPNIIRNFNLISQTIMLYDYNKIINELQISSIDFKTLLILSGTDYDEDGGYYTINELFKLHYKYNNEILNSLETTNEVISTNTMQTFYNWLEEYKLQSIMQDNKDVTCVIKPIITKEKFIEHEKLFDCYTTDLKQYETFKIELAPININKLITFLYDFGFLFT